MPQDESEQAFREQLQKARSGDRSALEKLLAQLQPRLLKEADRRLGDKLRAKTRASDVLQDAYIDVVRGIRGFAGNTEESFLAWVTTIIESSARQQHRHLNARRRRSPTHTSQLNALAQAFLKSSPSPVTQLEQAEEVELVMDAIESLREDHRMVIEQILLKKRSALLVAQDLGRTENAIRMLLSRARTALMIEIEKRDRPNGTV